MKNLLFFLVIAILVVSCNGFGPGITGNGNIRTEKRTTPDFHAVKSAGSIDVEITGGDSYAVSVENDDNLLQYVETSVHDGTLIVDYKDGISINNDHAKVYITAPSLDKVGVSGSGDISIQGTLKNAREIEMDVSGSGNIKGAVDAPAIELSTVGSGDITLSGHTKDFTGSISGSGEMNCGDLQSENATVKVSGSGNAHVFASVHLTASASGSGDVYYRGNPSSPEIHTSGSGSVEPDK
jgi:Putative auto-transporter adhesin, head GIN domain